MVRDVVKAIILQCSYVFCVVTAMRNTTRKSVVKLITAGCKQRVWLCDAQTGLPDLMCCLLEKRRTWIKQGSAVRTPGCFVEHASTCVSRKVVVCESHVRARMWVAVGRLRQLWERHKDIGAQGRNQLFISGWGGNFHELSFDDVIVLVQAWYNFFANGHRYVRFATFPKMITY